MTPESPNRIARTQVRSREGNHFKDAILDRLAESANVAQFISFAPDGALSQRYCRIHGYSPNAQFDSTKAAVSALFAGAPEHSVNVRSFDPKQPKANEFIYGLSSVDAVITNLRRLSTAGFYTIVNETVDVADGGVSGVVYGNVLEFAPGDTPRCVEKPGTASFPRDLGQVILELVYGFRPSFSYALEARVEFSLHPIRRGVRREHTIIWEIEDLEKPHFLADLRWPNRFSRLVGDKAFGLLIAAALGLRVPATTVFGRGLAPFGFGSSTGTGETWIRTCPPEPVPGRYTTHHGWLDPFTLLKAEDESGSGIASVLAQEGVESAFSGAVVTDPDGRPVIEGVSGTGERFMLGRDAAQPLPPDVIGSVTEVFNQATQHLGAVGFEWVFDADKGIVWVVQLHQGIGTAGGGVLYPGTATADHIFNVEDGLEALRGLAASLKGTGEGIVLVGDVGITSHFGDVLRKAKIPSRIERNKTIGTSAVASNVYPHNK